MSTPIAIEIRVRGEVTEDVAGRLGLKTRVPPADVVLRGAVADRSALLGVLDRIRADGLELIEVRRLPDRGADRR